jgi:hypothetical protein
MSLPRPASIFDTLEVTGMFRRPRDESGPVAVAVGPDVTTCSDEEFEQWLATVPRDADGSMGIHPTDKTMMSAWMTLSLAATKEQVEYTALAYLDRVPPPSFERGDTKEARVLMLVARAERVQPMVFH